MIIINGDIVLGMTADLKIQIPIAVTVSQYMGETVAPYVWKTFSN